MVDTTSKKQNLRVFWKLMNPQECVWEIRCRIIMKTILQAKVRIHYSTTIWFTGLFLCLKLWKFRQQKQRWTRNGKIGEHFGVEPDKIRSQKEWIDEARTSGATVHFASLMDICQWKNAELEEKTKVELFSAVITLPQNIYAELIPAKKNCSCINK